MEKKTLEYIIKVLSRQETKENWKRVIFWYSNSVNMKLANFKIKYFTQTNDELSRQEPWRKEKEKIESRPEETCKLQNQILRFVVEEKNYNQGYDVFGEVTSKGLSQIYS